MSETKKQKNQKEKEKKRISIYCWKIINMSDSIKKSKLDKVKLKKKKELSPILRDNPIWVGLILW